MNTTEATALAVRYNQTWSNGPPVDLWEEAFKDCDAGKVGTVWAQLSKAGNNHVTIPKFYEIYNTLRTTDASTRPTRGDCQQPESCDNSGWATIWLKDDDGHEYSPGVEPCRCAWGRDREQVHRGIIDWNEAELERLAPGRTARKADEKRDAA